MPETYKALDPLNTSAETLARAVDDVRNGEFSGGWDDDPATDMTFVGGDGCTRVCDGSAFLVNMHTIELARMELSPANPNAAESVREMFGYMSGLSLKGVVDRMLGQRQASDAVEPPYESGISESIVDDRQYEVQLAIHTLEDLISLMVQRSAQNGATVSVSLPTLVYDKDRTQCIANAIEYMRKLNVDALLGAPLDAFAGDQHIIPVPVLKDPETMAPEATVTNAYKLLEFEKKACRHVREVERHRCSLLAAMTQVIDRALYVSDALLSHAQNKSAS